MKTTVETKTEIFEDAMGKEVQITLTLPQIIDPDEMLKTLAQALKAAQPAQRPTIELARELSAKAHDGSDEGPLSRAADLRAIAQSLREMDRSAADAKSQHSAALRAALEQAFAAGCRLIHMQMRERHLADVEKWQSQLKHARDGGRSRKGRLKPDTHQYIAYMQPLVEAGTSVSEAAYKAWVHYGRNAPSAEAVRKRYLDYMKKPK